ncbi:MAG: ABC transporter ATP-binding protein [Bdellovibrionales bacterium]
MSLLEVKNLKTQFTTEESSFLAVDDVSFSIKPGRCLGIVGESGCGKSVTSLSIMGLIQPPGKIKSGEIFFDNKNLLSLSEREFRDLRGRDISMIFQEPMTSLNPVYTIGNQIDEAIAIHQPELTSSQIKEKTIEMLKRVGIPSAEKRYSDFPHQLSGGMRQRVMIAMAISCNPKLLIADEPTTALDVTIQAQILDLLRDLQSSLNMSMILITHDLGVVAEMCHDVVVMYAGRIIEKGTVEEIFYRAKHPYTRGLIDSIPHFESGKRLSALKTIPGLVPNLSQLPRGCRFADRCNFVQSDCRETDPRLENLRGQHKVACHHPLPSEMTS